METPVATLRITETRIRLCDESKVRAWVSITLEDQFVIHGIKVIEGAEGLFVAMPSRKHANGDYRDVAHPIRREFRAYLEEVVLTAYGQALEGGAGEPARIPPGSGSFGAAPVWREAKDDSRGE
jgi:stage V sporulation protein G